MRSSFFINPRTAYFDRQCSTTEQLYKLITNDYTCIGAIKKSFIFYSDCLTVCACLTVVQDHFSG